MPDRLPLACVAALMLGCGLSLRAEDPPTTAPDPTPVQEAAVRRISARRLKEAVDFLAAPERGGRIPGSPGHREARDWIEVRMREIGLEPLGKDGGFLYPYPSGPATDRFQRNADGSISVNANDTGCNVIGLLRGTDPERAGEYIVYVAHYDHLGVTEKGVPFAGAFDDASGVAAGLEIARALKEGGGAPRRSIVFLISDEEEHGLLGAGAWLREPTVPRDKIVLGLSADPLGRRIVPDYGPIVVSGLERSPELLEFWRRTTGYAESEVVFIHRNVIPRFSSDHDEFHKVGIPALWLVNPGFTNYHKTGDLPETIDHRTLADTARYAARSMILAGNTDRRFEYKGVPPIGANTGRDARVLLEGVRKSKEISEAERHTVEQQIALLDQAIAADSLAPIPNPKKFFAQAMFFIFQLSYVHPGPTPPPFPAPDLAGKWTAEDGRTLELLPDGSAAWTAPATTGAAANPGEGRWRLDAAGPPDRIEFTNFGGNGPQVALAEFPDDDTMQLKLDGAEGGVVPYHRAR